MNRPEFVNVTYIDTSPNKVWEALTNGEFTRQWGGRSITSDWQVGSEVKHLKPDGSTDWAGEVLECDPPKRLSYTFDPSSEMSGHEGKEPDPLSLEKPTRVTFEIDEFLGKVRLTLTHDQFEPGSKVLQGISVGWPAILSSLKSLAENGEPLFPDWH